MQLDPMLHQMVVAAEEPEVGDVVVAGVPVDVMACDAVGLAALLATSDPADHLEPERATLLVGVVPMGIAGL
jgi:hypothetical protein